MTFATTSPSPLPAAVEGLPTICGWEADLRSVTQAQSPLWRSRSNHSLDRIRAGFAIALHMHQPTIPAGGNGALISNLQYMFEHPQEGDNHNAGPFVWCYSRMAELIPELLSQGCNPRIMLDYSGNLLWGLQQMGRSDVLDNLRRIASDAAYQPHVEWLGTLWSHAVVPSTPIPDLKLHIQAWQHQFAALFGWEALARVKGFSPPEMHLPNHPDTLFQFITALKECGYRWLLVQEHTVETLEGQPLELKHIPHRLVARNSQGETVSITALIKTQGSDTKLVGQMQPYYEAKTLDRAMLNGIAIPPIVTQISDGENGGVMMNEFPSAFFRAWQDMRDGNPEIVGFTGSEYLELIEAAGVTPADYPTCQAIGQHRIWQRVDLDACTPEAVAQAIAALRQEDPHFGLEGASWTNHLSWVRGYENVLTPMQQLSVRFHQTIDPLQDSSLTQQTRYRQALLYNLLLQTSCFRYWGQGVWTDYARQIYEQGLQSLEAFADGQSSNSDPIATQSTEADPAASTIEIEQPVEATKPTEPAQISIRSLQSRTEAESCAEMMAASEPWITFQRDLATCLQLITDRSREVYLAFDHDTIAGFLILNLQGSLGGYLQSICVDSAYRNRGIGRQLMSFAETRTFQETPNLFLSVSAFNESAKRFYLSLNYELVGELKDYMIAGHSEILLRKTIAPKANFRPVH